MSKKTKRDVLEYAIGDQPHRVDREKGIIHGVKILGLQSRNGPRYTPQAIASAAKLYDGAQVFVGHPEDRSRPGADRNPRDLFGWLQGVRVQTDGLFGDLHYIKSHDMAATVTELAERRPDKLGLSHNAAVTESCRGGDVVFESIDRVRSVDLVCKPATTAGIFESVADPSAPKLTDMKSVILAKVTEILRSDREAAAKVDAIALVVKELLIAEQEVNKASYIPINTGEPIGGATTDKPVTESLKERPGIDRARAARSAVASTPAGRPMRIPNRPGQDSLAFACPGRPPGP